MASVFYIILPFLIGILPFGLSNTVYYIKWIVTLLLLRIYKSVKKNRLDIYDVKTVGEPEKAGFLSHPTEVILESPCSELHLATADDKIFIYGINSKSESLVVSIARLPERKAEAIVYLRLASGQIYQLEKRTGYQQAAIGNNVFSCEGLQMYYLCPFRSWRIFYSGYLKATEADSPNVEKMVYVKFSFIWRASSDVYDCTSDMDDFNIVKSVAKSQWRTSLPPIRRLYNTLDYYAQSGVIMGTVSVDETHDFELYMFGHRIRQFGNMSSTENAECALLHGFLHKSGMYVQAGEFSASGITKSLTYGFLVKSDSVIKAVQNATICDGSTNVSTVDLKGTITAGRTYSFSGSTTKPILLINDHELFLRIDEIMFELNGKEGTGIYIKSKRIGSSSCKVVDVTPQIKDQESHYPLVVGFSERLCKQPEISGGKGSSLGILTDLSEKLNFTVPDGFVVTTASYKEFITEDVIHEIRNLEKTLYTLENAENTKEACERVQNAINSTKIPSHVLENIVMKLVKTFGDNYATKKLAVRSSATGEDTEQMSAAGQMDTYLGVTGLDNILLSIKKCWSSQFGFVAVQYKRRYGQALNSPMAVVVQEMVSCDVAGVLFTCDPVTGNPTKIFIAANFGVGESVVSGSVEPDSIELIRDYSDQLKVQKITVGSKSHKVVVTDDGTSLNDVPESERHNCCLTTDTAIKLGELAIAIEKHYKSKRDIEWGIQNENVYIFQSRPVTSGTEETDFEIEHELDGPLRTENDFFSVSNAGEVLPGAMTTLAYDVFFRMFDAWWQADREVEWLDAKPRFTRIGWLTMRNHCMFRVHDVFKSSDSKNLASLDKANMVAFFGRILDEEEIFEVNAEKNADAEPKTFIQKLHSFRKLSKTCLFSSQRLKKVQKKYLRYNVPTEDFKTSQELFKDLTRRYHELGEVFMCQLICTQCSTMLNMIILTILSQAKNGNFDEDVYSDFAKLVTNKGDVESADVPSAIQSLAFHVSKSIDPDKFKASTTEEALSWLQTTSTPIGVKFKEFLTKHGHRGIKEYEVSSDTWETNPKPLVKILQSLAGIATEESNDSVNCSLLDLIRQLKVPTNLIAKFMLLALVPLSRKAVRERECSKSLSVRGMDKWRKAYRRLAQMMVAEGRIPNEDIFYFFTLDDLKTILETRSPAILAKAYHRQKLHPRMERYIFPEIMKGLPRPIDELSDEVKEEELFSMKGIPVSKGVAKGYVRVAVSLQDAVGLKPGEIMLAYSTDIGWTPYFPSLAGVATELGGLISHGAVVSREYGLPCVAGLHGATRRFKTGDYVFLDGNKGILQKMSIAKEDQL